MNALTLIKQTTLLKPISPQGHYRDYTIRHHWPTLPMWRNQPINILFK